MTPATAILVPVLNRPHRVKPLIENIEAVTPEPHRVLFLASTGDTAEHEALERAADPWAINEETRRCHWQIIGGPGTWAQKINAGFHSTSEPFVFLAADDLKFHDGWLATALDIMEHAGVIVRESDDQPDWNRPGVVGTNDLCNPRTAEGTHSTHMLVRRSYIDEVGGVIDQSPGIVLNEDYPHDFVDDEFHETARFRGVYAHAFDSHVEHLHPLCGKAELDDTYRLGREVGPARGAELYQSRRALWGGGMRSRRNKWRAGHE